MTQPSPRWWQRGVVYQVYPRSFMDANGDGVGDLRGIIERLPYLQWLGVDAIWLSPIYPSPMADFGYDVSDFTAIDPVFGTLDDFDALVAAAHRADLRVILDFVPNHTSVEHEWFRESRSSRGNPKRSWYIWRDPAPGGGPPNNWRSTFGGSAWEWDERTRQYYYHAYLKEQPDLNWRTPEVRAAMLDVLRFWLAHGVDGFRVDVIWHLVKDLEFRDNPVNPAFQPGQAPFHELLPVYSTDRPEVHEIIAEMRAAVESAGDRVLIGEIYLPVERLVVYYGRTGRGLHLPFNFQLIEIAWDPRIIGEAIDRYEELLPPEGWPNWVLGNHDKRRVASRVGPPQARVAAMLLLTLRGTPTMYYGDELGMADVPIPPDQVKDPWERNEPGLGLGRDPVRTPMQWSPAPNAGFTAGTPWLPLAATFGEVNVETSRGQERSLLSLYRRLLQLRRAEPALHSGAYVAVAATRQVLAYVRAHRRTRLLVVLNFTAEPATFDPGPLAATWTVRLSTELDDGPRPRGAHGRREPIALRANEGLVIELQ